MKTVLTCLAAMLLTAAGLSTAQQEQPSPVKTEIDWEAFLKPKNMVWKKAPLSWDNAPFLGNGWIGMQVMGDRENDREIRFEVARMDAQEHLPYNKNGNKDDWAYSRYRLAIGYFTLQTEGRISRYDLELDLWNAELRGTITTDKGTIDLRAFAQASNNVLVIETDTRGKEPGPVWKWNPYPNVSPRTHSWKPDTGASEAPYAKPGPEGRLLTKTPRISVWEQPLRPSGQVATAWKEVSYPSNKNFLFVSIEHSYPQDTAVNTAVDLVRKASAAKPDVLTRLHRNWWHQYYPQAFLSLPDSYWDSFYWIQMYKIGSGMRADGPVLDLQGPWTGLPKTAWPGVWWNLNVQLTYWPCYTGNRLDGALSLPNNLKKYRDNLILNVEEPYRKDSAGIPRASGHDIHYKTGVPGATGSGSAAEVGSLAWACHNLYLHYRMTMDDAFLRDDVYPILRRAVNYYIHFLEKGDDGKWHLPPTLSPEYGTAPDCNYDLALLRWGCETLLWTTERLGIKDPLIPKWKDIVDNLTDYPVDENGYMIGKGVPFKNSHRHYSHLFMVYPLHLVDTTDPETAKLADKSIRHWHSLKGGLMGYSFSGGASLYASLGWGEEAFEMLNGLKRYMKPNTLYRETWPVMETPLSGAASIHDMILQSWNGLINIFPAVPAAWADISFHDLRAEGAFLVSASRAGGKTQWLRIRSLAGEPLKFKTDIASSAVMSGTAASAMKRGADGIWSGRPAKGSELILALPGVQPVVKPVNVPGGSKRFGMP